MTCEEVVRSEIVEKYLHDELGDELREAFEQHYFECTRCFDMLQIYRNLQAELARTRDAAAPAAAPRRSWVWQWAWLPATAVVLLAVGLALWEPPFADRSGPTEPTQEAAPSAREREPLQPSPPPKVSLADLARVDPPRYTPGRLRGAGDEATARFQQAMQHYQRGDYAAAIPGLGTAATLDPEAPHILFFLGVSRLMAGLSDDALDALGRTIALGDSPYTEEAHFFLAKAHLQKGNLDEARSALRRTVDIGGARGAEARQLLSQIDSLTMPPRQDE